MGHLGTVIRSLREQKGLTQAELAERANLNQSWLSRIENMERDRVDAHHLAVIAQALEVSIEEIYVAAGLAESTDRTADLRWRAMERIFRAMPDDRQEELLAIARLLASLSARQQQAPAKDATTSQ